MEGLLQWGLPRLAFWGEGKQKIDTNAKIIKKNLDKIYDIFFLFKSLVIHELCIILTQIQICDAQYSIVLNNGSSKPETTWKFTQDLGV